MQDLQELFYISELCAISCYCRTYLHGSALVCSSLQVFLFIYLIYLPASFFAKVFVTFLKCLLRTLLSA